MAHQTDALSFFERRQRAFFAMEMRLGKTPTCLWWLNRNFVPQGRTWRSPTACLVVGPLSVLPGWEEEAERERIPTTMLAGRSKAKQAEVALSFFELFRPGDPMHLFITNWQSLIEPGHRTHGGKPRPMPSALCLLPWDGAVLDESTAIRKPSTQTTRVVRKHLRPRVRACLSGLPNPEGPLDFFEQCCWVWDRFAGVSGYWEGRDKYFQEAGYDWVPKRGTGKVLRQAFHKRAFVLSRKDAGLATTPIRQKIWVDLPAAVRRMYDLAEKEWELEGEWTKWMPVVRSWLAGLAGGRPKERPELWSDHKLTVLADALTGGLGFELAREPVVVWFARNTELHAAARFLRKRKVTCRALTGTTKLDDRRDLGRAFRDGRFRVLLAQTQVGKFGLDLSVASTVIRYSHVYEYEAHHQSDDRTEHPTKTDPTLHLSMVCRGTVDEDVVNTLAEKGLTAKLFLKRLEDTFAARWRRQHAA